MVLVAFPMVATVHVGQFWKLHDLSKMLEASHKCPDMCSCLLKILPMVSVLLPMLYGTISFPGSTLVICGHINNSLQGRGREALLFTQPILLMKEHQDI